MADFCGHEAEYACPCEDPPLLLCKTCYCAHAMSPVHPNVRACVPRAPSQSQVHSALRVLAEQFDGVMQRLTELKVNFLRRIQASIEVASNENSTFAQALRSNSLHRLFQPLFDRIVEGAQMQTENFLTLAEGLNLHAFSSEAVHQFDLLTANWRPAVSLARTLHMDADSFWVSASNSVLFVCNPSPYECYKVSLVSGDVKTLRAMRRHRRAFGVCCAEVEAAPRVFAIGGIGAEYSAETFIEPREQWVMLEGEMALPRHSFQPVTHGDRFFLIGGSHPSVEIRKLNWQHDKFLLMQFSNLGPTTAVVQDDRLIVLWGSNKRIWDFAFSQVIDLQLQDFTWSGNTFTAPVYSRGKIWVLYQDNTVSFLEV